MNEQDESRHPDPDAQRAIDQLVDGELDDQRKRQLLASLDYTDGGWRQLALTFVESQTLRGDFGEVLSAECAASADDSGASQIAPVSKPVARWLLAAAASFAVALWLGLLLRGQDQSSITPDAQIAAEEQPDLESDGAASNLELARQEEAAAASRVAPPPKTGRASAAVESTVDADLELPVFQASTAIEPFAGLEQSPLPPDVAAALQRSGHRVRRWNQLKRFRLPDGRRVLVPVEHVELERLADPYQ